MGGFHVKLFFFLSFFLCPQFLFSFTTLFSPPHPLTRPSFKHVGIATSAAPFMIIQPSTVCSEKRYAVHVMIGTDWQHISGFSHKHLRNPAGHVQQLKSSRLQRSFCAVFQHFLTQETFIYVGDSTLLTEQSGVWSASPWQFFYTICNCIIQLKNTLLCIESQVPPVLRLYSAVFVPWCLVINWLWKLCTWF